MGTIVIFEEKHEEIVYDIAESGGWDRVCMDVFQRRDREGWWYSDPGPEPTQPNTNTSTEKLDPQALRKLADDMESFKRRHSQWRDDRRFWKFVERARKGDFGAAVEIIEGRKGAEYEGYKTLTTTQVSKTVPWFKHAPRARVVLLAHGIANVFEQLMLGKSAGEAAPFLEMANETQQERPPAGPQNDEELDPDYWIKHLNMQLSRVIQFPLLDHQRYAWGALQRVSSTYKLDWNHVLAEVPKWWVEHYGSVDAVAQAMYDERLAEYRLNSKYRQEFLDNREKHLEDFRNVVTEMLAGRFARA